MIKILSWIKNLDNYKHIYMNINVLISRSYPAFKSIFFLSFKNPVLISGPLVSNIIAQLMFTFLLAYLTLSNTSPWALWSPWEKFNLATFIPSMSNYSMV